MRANLPTSRARSGAFLLVIAACVAGPVSPARAQAPPTAAQDLREEIDRLRKDFDALRAQYDARIAGLETRLSALEQEPAAAGGTTTPGAQPTPGTVTTATGAPPAADVATAGAGAAGAQPGPVQVPAGAAGAGGPAGTLPVYGNVSAASKIFNPDVAVIGNFLGAAGTNRIDPSPALDLHEVETSFQAIVDPYARGDVFLSVSPDGIDVEEGFITFTALPGGLLAKVGKMRAAFGKVNTFHTHTTPWTDRPLVTRNLVGGEEGISDAGISVSKLLLNPWFFLEATGEVYRGESAIFAAHERSDLSYVARLRGYRDLTESANIDLGTSFAYGHNQFGPDDTTRLFGVDATFRFRPLQRAIYRQFIGRSEFVWSRGEQPTATTTSFGMYASGDYQFARRWFAGGRLDYSARAFEPGMKDKGGSLLVTFWPSEFSQVRGQYRRTRYAENVTANEVLFQFLFSIGAHGAHAF